MLGPSGAIAARVVRSSASASALARLIASSASLRLRRPLVLLQVQRDVGLHLDRGQAVPDHVVHLLREAQPLGVDEAALRLGALPGAGLGHQPPGHARS